MGENARIEDIPKDALPSNVDVHMVKTDEVPASVRSAVWAFVISHSTHYIGDLEPLYVKIGLVLGLGNYAAFPKIVAGKSLWNDAYGFASCTAEEFNAHMKVASGVPLEFITSKFSLKNSVYYSAYMLNRSSSKSICNAMEYQMFLDLHAPLMLWDVSCLV